jgi:arabinogalactan endo-1,4-beta-galactosidase
MRTLKVLLISVLLVALTPAAAQAAPLTMLGADVSSLQRTLDLGGKYYKNGAATDPYDILKGAGANYMRLRVWNNPASGYNNKAKVLQQARAIKAKGLKLMVDFHYSDTWADPGKQFTPAAWSTHSLSQLQTDVYNYTYDVCTALKAQGTTPDSVQIGNEINVGMLWPRGQVVNSNFAPLAAPLKQGYNATKACNSSTQVLIHTANSDSQANARWFYDGIRAAGVTWDVTALSYYCMWHGTLTNLYNVITDMRTRYGKPVVIVETAYQFTRPSNSAGCRTPPATPAPSASSTGNPPGTPSAATAGTRQTSTAPVTAGTTWPSSTGPATSTPTSDGPPDPSHLLSCPVRLLPGRASHFSGTGRPQSP